MYYTIYKITNLLNGKIYIGSHKTKEVNDQYMGSGKYLRRSIEKNGIENFKKEILFVFDNPDEMYAKEAELVNEDFLANENTYNLKVGGFGGWDYLNDKTKFNNPTHSKEHAKRMSDAGREKYIEVMEKLRADSVWVTKFSKICQEAQLLRYSKDNPVYGFLGKKHTTEAKLKISQKNKINQKGEKNSQYGKEKSEEHIKKVKDTFASKPYIKCPHCGLETKSVGALKRWHLDNCKIKRC